MDTAGTNRTVHDLGEVLRRWGGAYSASHPVSAHQRRVLTTLSHCRTSALGGHLEQCDRCGFERPVYNSCGDRNCPTCQGKLARKWLSERLADVLNTSYFHCVFTIPDTFNVLVPYNESRVYNALFTAASGTLLSFSRRLLGGRPALLGVLHTWGQTLWLHPHVHFVVSGGALSADGRRWRSSGPDFLFDVFALSAEFRSRFCALLRRSALVFRGEAAMYADRARFDAFLSEQEQRDWVVFAKKPFAGPRQVLEYISRYTHRVAISNRRIVDVSDAGTVTFTYRDYRQRDAAGLAPERSMTLPAPEFIGRFLRHVLPKGLRKIRAYGLLAGRERAAQLAAARALLGPVQLPAAPESAQFAPSEPLRCPHCGVGTLQRGAVIARARPPPVVLAWSRSPEQKAA